MKRRLASRLNASLLLDIRVITTRENLAKSICAFGIHAVVCSMLAEINHDRQIGIEIEVVVPIIGVGENRDVQRLIAEVLTNHGIQSFSRGYTHQPVPAGSKFAIEHDVSLRDESRYAGLRWSKIEAKTAPMTWDEIEQVLPPALDIIRYVGSRANYSCGLHVHHHLPEAEQRPEVVRNLQHLWWRFHPIMYALVAPSRKSNQYCRPPQIEDAKRFDRVYSYASLCRELQHVDRYHGLNFANLANRDRMTVEWRIYGGTTEWEKIKAWVLATQRWTEHAVKRSCHFKAETIANTQQGLNSLLMTTGLKPNSRIYRKVDKELRQVGRFLLKRWKHFNLPRDFKKKAVA
jgi:hypothetical protein